MLFNWKSLVNYCCENSMLQVLDLITRASRKIGRERHLYHVLCTLNFQIKHVRIFSVFESNKNSKIRKYVIKTQIVWLMLEGLLTTEKLLVSMKINISQLNSNNITSLNDYWLVYVSPLCKVKELGQSWEVAFALQVNNHIESNQFAVYTYASFQQMLKKDRDQRK